MRFILDLTQEHAAEYFKRFAAALKRLGRPEVEMQPVLFDFLQRATASDFAMLAGLMKDFNAKNPLVAYSGQAERPFRRS